MKIWTFAMKPGISEWKSVRNSTQISVQNSAEFSAQNSAQISAQISARNTCNSAEFRAKRSEFTHHHPSPDPTLQPTTPESSAESTIPSTHLENMCISTSTDGTTRRISAQISAQISAEFSAQNSALISPADLQVPAAETPEPLGRPAGAQGRGNWNTLSRWYKCAFAYFGLSIMCILPSFWLNKNHKMRDFLKKMRRPLFNLRFICPKCTKSYHPDLQPERNCEFHDVERGRISHFLNSYGQRTRHFGERNRKVQKMLQNLTKMTKSCKYNATRA